MRTVHNSRVAVAGILLIAVGAAVAALGAAGLPAAATTALPPVGGSLLGAGIIVLVASVDLDSRRRVVVGAALVAGGVTLAVTAAVAGVATTTLTACGAALVTAGVVTLVHGAADLVRAARPASAEAATRQAMAP